MSTAPLDSRLERRRHPSSTPASRERFAHPSERVFASLLDLYGIGWVYEPIEFPLRWSEEGDPSAGFRPDFWLPEQACFIELTTAEQRLVTRKNAKVRRMRELYPEIDVQVVYQRDYVALAERHRLSVSEVKAV